MSDVNVLPDPLHNADDRLRLACLVPEAPGITDVHDQTAALHLAVVDRTAVRDLGDAWEVPGTHVLLDAPRPEGSWSAYAGEAPVGYGTDWVLQAVETDSGRVNLATLRARLAREQGDPDG